MNTFQSVSLDFIKHCKYEKNLSPKTIKFYGIDLKQLTGFLLNKGYSTEIEQITKIELKEYLETISFRKPKTIKRKIATIKAVFNFLEYEDRILVNPLRKMKIKLKEPKRLPTIMNIDEIGKIFNTAYERRKSSKGKKRYSNNETIRDIVVIELLFATGARVSELADLKIDNIELSAGSLTIKGKGDKERIIQICNKETIRILKCYQSIFHEKMHASGGYFLINRVGTRLSDQSIRNIVKRLTKRAGIQRHITPHVFRHSFATLLLEKDVDIKYIQALLGHSSIMTTQLYTHVNREKQRQILLTKHPRKDFSMRMV